MLLHISERSTETLQEQISGQIRARILSGELEPDHALPSIRALARQIRVSVITVQRAYDLLLNEEVIYARRGKGFFVAALDQSDKSSLAGQRFTGQLTTVVRRALSDGLSEKEINRLFAESLQAEKQRGDNDDDA